MPPPAPAVFSTVGLPTAQRVELWETHNAAALIGLDVHSIDPLRATEVNIQLQRIQLARVVASAHVVRRNANVIDRSPADAVAVYLSLRGDAWFESPRSTRALRPGDVLICETDRPFSRGFARGLEELVVKVPRSDFAEVADAMSLPRAVIAARGAEHAIEPYARALARITGRALRADCPRPADEGTVLDLVAVLAQGPAVAQSTAHRSAAHTYIEDHLSDPNLGAVEIAAATGISERQLSRVFAADGTTVPRHILARRLQLAYSLLSCAPSANETIAHVAARCGFTSVTYFSRVFRAQFGVRAGDVRRGFSATLPLA